MLFDLLFVVLCNTLGIVEEKLFILSVQTWWDTHLNWDASEHYNITTLFLDPQDIWMPEIAIHNT